MKLNNQGAPRSVRVIKRNKLEETVYNKLKASGDPSHITATLGRALGAITECRVADEGKTLYTLMGMHVYKWNNKELIESVQECFDVADEVSEDIAKNNRNFIIELAENDKRIFATN